MYWLLRSDYWFTWQYFMSNINRHEKLNVIELFVFLFHDNATPTHVLFYSQSRRMTHWLKIKVILYWVTSEKSHETFKTPNTRDMLDITIKGFEFWPMELHCFTLYHRKTLKTCFLFFKDVEGKFVFDTSFCWTCTNKEKVVMGELII